MKYYAVAEIDVADPGWIESYVREVTPLVERFGGRYLARTSRVEKLEGSRPVPQVCLLEERPSREAAIEFYESEAYRPHRKQRQAGARSDLALVAGEDITGAARMPE